MIKTILFSLLIIYSSTAFSQHDFFVLKKHNQTIQTFFESSHITFQFNNGDWITGIITKIQNDSFYFKQEVIHYYGMGTDTQYFSGYKIALSDVHAIPRKNFSYNYEGNNIVLTEGNQRENFIKDGSLFKLLGGGYIALNIINHLIDKDAPFAKDNFAPLSIAAAVYLAGVVMHGNRKPVMTIGGKYRLEYVNLNNKQ